MDNNEEKNEVNKLNISLSPEVAEGVYSNMVMITHSPCEFLIDFVRLAPGAEAKVKSRVVLSPKTAKRMLLMMQENVARYESAFGTINPKDAPQDQFISPFFGSGQA